MRARRSDIITEHGEEFRRRRAREGKVVARMRVGRNHEHLLELGTTTWPVGLPLTEQNIIEVEAAIAAFRERRDTIARGAEVMFPRVETLPL